MTEIKLTKRYPQSRAEDITDAFMRGYEQGKKDGLKVGKQIVLGAFETYITADRKTEQTEPSDWKDQMWNEAVEAEQTEPQTHDIRTETHECVKDTHDRAETMSCQECKWWFTDSLKHGGYCQSLLYNHECHYEPEVDCSWK